MTDSHGRSDLGDLSTEQTDRLDHRDAVVAIWNVVDFAVAGESTNDECPVGEALGSRNADDEVHWSVQRPNGHHDYSIR